jgi:hypothetical protein
MLTLTRASIDYPTIKKKLRKNTLVLSSVFTTYYGITIGEPGVVSAIVGGGASLTYIELLSKNVDTLDFSKSAILVPLAVALMEKAIPYDFNYEATLVTFLSYQFAVLSLLYDEVVQTIIKKK